MRVGIKYEVVGESFYVERHPEMSRQGKNSKLK